MEPSPLGSAFRTSRGSRLMIYMLSDAKVIADKMRAQVELTLNYQEGSHVKNNTKSWMGVPKIVFCLIFIYIAVFSKIMR